MQGTICFFYFKGCFKMKSFVFISPEEHFSEVVKEACLYKNIKSEPYVDAYLVQLLKFYLDSKNLHRTQFDDSNEKPPETFAEMYLLAINENETTKKSSKKKKGVTFGITDDDHALDAADGSITANGLAGFGYKCQCLFVRFEFGTGPLDQRADADEKHRHTQN